MFGMVMAFCAYAMFAVMTACAKILSDSHHIVEIAFFRNLVAIIPLLVYLGATRQFSVIKTNKRAAIVLRAVMGAVTLIVSFAAFAHLPMANATVLLFTSTLLTPVLAFIFLKEQIGPRRWAAIFIGLLGVIIMVGPTLQYSLLGVFFGLTAAVTQASWLSANTLSGA